MSKTVCASHWFSTNTVIPSIGYLELFILVYKVQGGGIHSTDSYQAPSIVWDTR